LNQEEPDEATLLELITSSWKSQALRVAAELRVPELLAGGPRTSAQLAEHARAHQPSLHRLLRALTTIDILRENDDGTFVLTPMGTLLGSLRSWSIWWGAHAWPEWGRLLESVKTGRSVRSQRAEAHGFESLDADPEVAAVFNSAMAELTRLEVNGVVRAYDFSPFQHIVDVGGGYGELLVAILNAHPRARGTIVDLPHSVDGARRHVEEAGVADRCEVLPGDFFERVPPGADAYIVKNVVHDWDDRDALRILESCHQAMPAHAKLLLIERVMPDRFTVSDADQSAARSDLHMLIAHGARERTQAEFDELLVRSRFRLQTAAGAAGGLSVLEAIPV
jgi:hypothetical protein